MRVSNTAATLAAVTAGIAMVLACFVMELGVLVGISYAVSHGQNAATIGWDPISLWRQSLLGKVVLSGVCLFVIGVQALAVLFGVVTFRRVRNALSGS